MRRIDFAPFFIAAWVMATHATGHELHFEAQLSGLQQEPANDSAGVGSVTATIDLDLVTLHVEASFGDLAGAVNGAHLHGLTVDPLIGVAGIAVQEPMLPGFPLGVVEGSYDHTIDLTVAGSYSPAFIAASGGTVSGALNALIFGMQEGRVYFDIKTETFPQGEIRGFLIEHHLPGDVNCDGAVSVADIGPFVLALTDPAAYAQQFPKCELDHADVNRDGEVTVSDIGPFVAVMTQ